VQFIPGDLRIRCNDEDNCGAAKLIHAVKSSFNVRRFPFNDLMITGNGQLLLQKSIFAICRGIAATNRDGRRYSRTDPGNKSKGITVLAPPPAAAAAHLVECLFLYLLENPSLCLYVCLVQ